MRIIHQPEKSLTNCPYDKAIHFPHSSIIKSIHDLTNPINIQYLHISAENHNLAPIYR